MDNLEKKAFWLTTSDNPYDPFNDFSHWYDYDTKYQANVASIIARIAKVSSEIPDDEYTLEVNNAIDFIVGNGLVDGYIKVSEDNYVNDKIMLTNSN